MANASNSWWLSAFLTDDENNQYLALSHILVMNSYTVYRSSLFDIHSLVYNQYSNHTTDSTVLDNSQGGEFNVSIGGTFFFGSTAPGNATKQLRAATTTEAVQFDLVFDLSAPILWNMGIGGLFQFGSAQTGEWSMPAGRTTGTVVRNGTAIPVNPARSLTWFDRQWNVGNSPGSLNWTWFELHLTSASSKHEKVSLWVYDSESVGHRQWATIHTAGNANIVEPVASFESFGDTWTSPATNITYAQHWDLSLSDGTQLTISSIYPDQEIVEGSAYEGFVVIKGTDGSGGCISGYGLVEMTNSGL